MTLMTFSKGDQFAKIYSEIVQFEEYEKEFSFCVAGKPCTNISRDSVAGIVLLADNGDVLFRYEEEDEEEYY